MTMFERFLNWRGRWRRGEGACEKTPRETALLPRAFLSVLEDVLAWDNLHLSLGFLTFVNILFVIFAQLNVSFLECLFMAGMMATCLDGLETWLRLKHRTACLERLAQCDNTRLYRGLARARRWLAHRKDDFITLRESNPTKAFLLVNIILGGVLVVGKAISGALLLYLVTMTIILFPVATPHLLRFVKKIHQVEESDGEMDSLIPELSEHNIKELNFESEPIAERHSVEKWLPEEAAPGDLSDSEDDSISAGHLPADAAAFLEPSVSTDSSEDEYLPDSSLEREKPRSTVVVLPTAPATWSGSAASALWSLSGALSSMMASAPTRAGETKHISSADSSDGFEFIDQSDL